MFPVFIYRKYIHTYWSVAIFQTLWCIVSSLNFCKVDNDFVGRAFLSNFSFENLPQEQTDIQIEKVLTVKISLADTFRNPTSQPVLEIAIQSRIAILCFLGINSRGFQMSPSKNFKNT